MNIPLSIPDANLAAWNRRLAQFNAGSGQPAITLEAFAQTLLDEYTSRFEADFQDALRAQMRETADELIAAANGDTQKLQEALTAGKTAALGVLNA